jgi:hypothetical protein
MVGKGTVIEHEAQETKPAATDASAGAMAKTDTTDKRALAAEEAFKGFNPNSAIVVLSKMAMSGVSKETIQQMKELVEWDDARRALAEFDAAFSLARGEFKEAKKSGLNTHINRAYSLLEDYDEATRESLSKHGLSWRHIPTNLDNGVISIKLVLAHKGGHRETAELRAPISSVTNKMINDLQAAGIVVMYLKRITLASMLGLVSDSEFDNDGVGGDGGRQQDRAPVSQPQRRSSGSGGNGSQQTSQSASKPATSKPAESKADDGTPLKEGQVNLVRAKLKAANLAEADLCTSFDVKAITAIPASKINAVLEWIKKNG